MSLFMCPFVSCDGRRRGHGHHRQKVIIFVDMQKILDLLGQSDISINVLFCISCLSLSHLQAILNDTSNQDLDGGASRKAL